MIITCPRCATSYDVEDDRFLPAGRSVRCAECGDSWFVPPAEPVENLITRRGGAGDIDRERAPERRAPRTDGATEEEEAALFSNHRTAPDQNPDRRPDRIQDRRPDERSDGRSDGRAARRRRDARRSEPSRRRLYDDEGEEGYPPRGGERPRRPERSFDDARDQSERPRPAPAPPGRDDGYEPRMSDLESERKPARDDDHQLFASLAENTSEERKNRKRARDLEEDDFSASPRHAPIVDADWEDVDRRNEEESGEDDRGRGYGRRVREERRRSSALVRPDRIDTLDGRYFDEEFFSDLRVQPKELEKALKKARRRAEIRDKNRLTPLRVLGWSMWLAAVTATLFVIFAYRNEIVRTWPNAAGAYAVIGIAANPYGLAIESVGHRLAMSTAGPTIEITGRLRNEKDAAVKTPLLQAEALGPRGELLSRWTFEAESEEVLAGGVIDFITRAPAPEGVAEVALSFAPEKGGVVSVGDFLTRRDN